MTDAEQPTRITSPWAVAAALCCLSLCLVPVAPVLGWRALVDIRSRPDRSGRRLAWASIVVSITGLIGVVIFGIWWNANVRSLIIDGPEVPLRRGLAGDVTAFTSSFDPAVSPSRDDAIAFLDELSGRYGVLLDLEQDEAAQSDVDFNQRARTGVLMYTGQFEDGTPLLEAELLIRDEQRGWVLAWRRLTIRDPELGDLTYPSNTP